MNRIAVIYDDLHPLLTQVNECLANRHSEFTMIKWSEITFDFYEDCIHCPTLAPYNAIFLDRMGEQERSYHTQLDLLANSDVAFKTVNHPTSYRIARDKTLSQALLTKLRLPVPRGQTVMSASVKIQDLGEDLAIKSSLGFCAKEVWLGKSSQARKALESILKHDGLALVQEYVNNTSRSIWRVDVVDGTAVTINQRFAASAVAFPIVNGAQGGDVKFYNPKSKKLMHIVKLAENVSKSMGLSISGVDMIQNNDGDLMLLEVNPEPDETYNSDLAYLFPNAIAELLLKICEKGKNV